MGRASEGRRARPVRDSEGRLPPALPVALRSISHGRPGYEPDSDLTQARASQVEFEAQLPSQDEAYWAS